MMSIHAVTNVPCLQGASAPHHRRAQCTCPWAPPLPSCCSRRPSTSSHRHGPCTWLSCPGPSCRSPPRHSVRRPRARCTFRTSSLRPWGSPGSHTACLRTTVCTPGAARGGWGGGVGKPPRERTSPLHRNLVRMWGALQKCRASMLLHMCVACMVPRPLTTAVRAARARGPRQCAPAAVDDRAPFPTAVRNARAHGPCRCAPTAVGDRAPFPAAVRDALARGANGAFAAAFLVAAFAAPVRDALAGRALCALGAARVVTPLACAPLFAPREQRVEDGEGKGMIGR